MLPKDAKPTPADQFLFWCRSDFQTRHDDGPVGFLYLARADGAAGSSRRPRRRPRLPRSGRGLPAAPHPHGRARGLPATGLLEPTDRGRPSFLPRPHRPGDHGLHTSPPAQPRPAGRPHQPAHLVSRPELPGSGAPGVSGGAALQSRGRRQARRGPKAVQRAHPRLGRPGGGQGKGCQEPAGSVRGGVGRAAGVRSGQSGAPEVRPGRQGAFHPFTLGSGRFRPGGRNPGAGAVPAHRPSARGADVAPEGRGDGLPGAAAVSGDPGAAGGRVRGLRRSGRRLGQDDRRNARSRRPGHRRRPAAGVDDRGGHAGPARSGAAGRQPGVLDPHRPLLPGRSS